MTRNTWITLLIRTQWSHFEQYSQKEQLSGAPCVIDIFSDCEPCADFSLSPRWSCTPRYIVAIVRLPLINKEVAGSAVYKRHKLCVVLGFIWTMISATCSRSPSIIVEDSGIDMTMDDNELKDVILRHRQPVKVFILTLSCHIRITQLDGIPTLYYMYLFCNQSSRSRVSKHSLSTSGHLITGSGKELNA